VAKTLSQPIVIPNPADAPAWRPRSIVVVAALLMSVGAFGPWLAGRLSGDAAGITLGGDGWILVFAATCALLPVALGTARGVVGVWVFLNAMAGGVVCLVHFQQAEMDGFRNGWGLYVGSAGCVALGFAGLHWLLVALRPD